MSGQDLHQERIELRHRLHSHPALSGREEETTAMVLSYCLPYTPSLILSPLGRTGLAVIYDFDAPGPAVMIRCELDALPIHESCELPYRSKYPGIAHKCGHDGHMAIVAGLCPWLQHVQGLRGRVILLFQPAEETGEGALAILADPAFASLEPDYIFALHNIPGIAMHSVIVLPGQFSAAVKSCKIYYTGISSHAAEPEKGLNPAIAIAGLVCELNAMQNPDPSSPDFSIITPVCIRCGTPDYGISAGVGEYHITIRTWKDEHLETLCHKVEQISQKLASAHQLGCTLEWHDHFPASINDAGCNETINRTAASLQFPCDEAQYPFRFGEDFGWYSKSTPSAMFGLGAGIDTPNLHHPEYDFPDELIESGITLFKGIIQQVLKTD